MADSIIFTKIDEWSSSTEIWVQIQFPLGYGYYYCSYDLYKPDGKIADTGVLNTSQSSQVVGFTNLVPDTVYILKVEVSARASQSSGIGTVYRGEVELTTGSSGPGEDAYVPDMTMIRLRKDDFTTTTSSIGVYFAGLDPEFKGLWSVTDFYAQTGTQKLYFAPISFYGGSDVSEIYVFQNLSPGTQYEIHATISCTANGEVYTRSPQAFMYTDEKVVDETYRPEFGDTRIVIDSVGTTSITAHIEGLDTNYSAEDEWELLWYVIDLADVYGEWERKADIYPAAGNSSSESVTLSGLKQNTYYDIRVRIRYRCLGSSEYEYIYTEEPVLTGASASYVPDIDEDDLKIRETSAPTDNSLKLRVEGLDAAYSGSWEFEWNVYRYYNDGTTSYVKTATSSDGGSISKSSYVTISGLASGVNYLVGVYVTVTVRGISHTWYTEGIFNTSGDAEPDDTYGGAIGAYLVLVGADDGTWISAYVDGLDTSYSTGERGIHWYVNGIKQGDTTFVPAHADSTEDDPYTIWTTPGNKYTVRAVVVYELDGSVMEYPLPEQEYTATAPDETWTVYPHGPYNNLTVERMLSIRFGQGEAARISFTCAYSGKIQIYSTGSTDVIGYLSDSTEFDTSTGIPDSVLAEDDESGTGSNFSLTYSVTAGTRYYFYCRCYYANRSGTSSIYIIPPNKSSRPEYFEWDNPKVKGGDFNITASEWKRLLDNINAVRKYRGLPNISNGSTVGYFLYPVKGDDFRALHYNQALNGITGILGTGYNANAVYTGEDVTAAKINLLRDMINDIE